MTVNEIFNNARREAERLVNNGESKDVIIYLSGSKNKKTRLENTVIRYRSDSKIDFDLEIIDKERYDFEMKVAEIIERSLKNYVIF